MSRPQRARSGAEQIIYHLVLPLLGLILLLGSMLYLLALVGHVAASGIAPAALLPVLPLSALWLMLFAVREALS